MQRTTYNSIPGTKILSLAENTWQEFSPFLSHYQWAFDDPKNSPRAKEIASAIKNKGKKGACTFIREEGYKIILRPLHAWAFDQAINKNRRIYYVSHGNYALLYLDIGLHYAWQSLAEGENAK